MVDPREIRASNLLRHSEGLSGLCCADQPEHEWLQRAASSDGIHGIDFDMLMANRWDVPILVHCSRAVGDLKGLTRVYCTELQLPASSVLAATENDVLCSVRPNLSKLARCCLATRLPYAARSTAMPSAELQSRSSRRFALQLFVPKRYSSEP